MTDKRHPWHELGPTRSPCKDCEERVLGCHDRCGRYAAYKAKLAMRTTERERTTDADAVTIDALRRIKKHQRKRRR